MAMASQVRLYAPAYMHCVFANISLFAGELPKELGDLVNLTELYLFGNEFGGELYVPSYITANASKFKLHFPQIAGTIPVEFGQLVNLQELSLWNNKLTGAIVCPVLHSHVG